MSVPLGGERDLALCFSFDFCRLISRSFWSFHVLNVSSALCLLSLFSSSLSLRSSLCAALSFFINSSSCFCFSQFLKAAWPTPRFCSAISSFNWAAFLSSAAIFWKKKNSNNNNVRGDRIINVREGKVLKVFLPFALLFSSQAMPQKQPCFALTFSPAPFAHCSV